MYADKHSLQAKLAIPTSKDVEAVAIYVQTRGSHLLCFEVVSYSQDSVTLHFQRKKIE